MPTILLCECIHEVSSFNPVAGRYRDFHVTRGEAIPATHHGLQSEVAGALSVFAERPDVQVIPGYSCRGVSSGGTIVAADWERISREFLKAVRLNAKVDAVYFALHGAMAAENEDDPEGYLLAEARRHVGEKTPIVVSLDLHGILTPRMLEHADAIVAYHTYPHVDFCQTGARAARLLLRIMSGEVRPVTAVSTVPALVRGDELITATGKFGECIRKAQAIEGELPGVSAGMFIGNPFTDVPCLQTYSFVVTNGDEAKAARDAEEIARLFWQHHESMRVPLTSLQEAVKIATETKDGTVVLVDAADATSSGASGDSNAILRALVESNYQGRALIPIVDPPTVSQAFAFGIGGEIKARIGGALDKGRFRPLEMKARVRMLSDGNFPSESNGATWTAGRTAVLEAGNFTIVATTRPVHLFDRSLFYGHGQDPQRFDLVVVKSPHCQEHMFAKWCRRMVNVDAPGSTSANVKSLGHTKCPRPIFPLDETVPFDPTPRIYTRPKPA